MTDLLIAQETLYAGPELHQAAERSQIHQTLRGRLDGTRNAVAILVGAAGNRLRRRNKTGLELVIATGEAPDTGNKLTVAYAGPGDNRAWCLSTALARYEISDRIGVSETGDMHRVLADAQVRVDVFFSEGLPARFFSQAGRPFVSMPAWVKQRVRVLTDWSAQIDGLRRETRQETGRILRKYRYACHLTRNPDDHAHFHDRLYKPYAAQRFGSAAHLVERRTFLKECDRGVLLRLTQENAVLGAALLRPVGRTMAVVWSALDPDRDTVHLRGVTDALDYFSLLYAHLQGCRWLDLGPSRPDLLDGILRYKAKWGGAIHSGIVPQAKIFWSCDGQSDGALDFLRRHAFLVADGSRAVVFADGNSDTQAFRTRLSAIRTAGVRDYKVIALSPTGDSWREAGDHLDATVVLVDANSHPDLMTAIKRNV